jgi:hypothetical protein
VSIRSSKLLLFYSLLLILFFLALSAPVIAQTDEKFTHTIYYDIGGRIAINRQLGHECTTGAVKRQTINGYGEVKKAETVKIAANIITVDETLDWSVPAGAIGNLSVVTTIDLCSRPMSVVAEVYKIDADNDLKIGDVINTYHPLVVDGTIKVAPVSEQHWATALTTNPGHEGGLHQEFFAAYGPGPYERALGAIDKYGRIFYYDEKYMWEYREGVSHLDRDHKTRGYKRGDYYVGDYFNIEQYAYTSSGSLRRYISMSNPFENTVLNQELDVTGMASVRDTFAQHNLKGGPKAITLAWYELF